MPLGDLDRSGAEGDARELLAKAHWAIDKATRDFERGFQFNTAIAAVMELVNEAYRLKDGLSGDPTGSAALRFATATAASLIFPFAPHLGAEIWERLNGGRVWEEPWPEADPALLAQRHGDPVVQVNGKLRDRIEVAADAPEESCWSSRGPARTSNGSSTARDRQGDRRPGQARQPGGSLSRDRVRRPYLVESARMLVRRLSDAPVEEFHRLRSHVLMDAGELGARNVSVTWLEVPAGADQTLRSHEEAEQVYVVVRGGGTMSVAGDTQRVEEGDLILVPPATDHSIANDGDSELACVSVQSPPVAVDRALRRPDGRGHRLRRREDD